MQVPGIHCKHRIGLDASIVRHLLGGAGGALKSVAVALYSVSVCGLGDGHAFGSGAVV